MDSTVCCVVVVFLCLRQTSSSVLFKDPILYTESVCQLRDGRSGVCGLNCTDISLEKDQPTICSYEKSVPVICCPNEKAVVGKSYPTIERVCLEQKQGEEEKKAERERIFESCKIVACEIPPRRPAEQHEHSHMAVLGWHSRNNLTDWKCGGSLIHPTFLLTAAHCIEPLGIPDVVRIGGVDLQDDENDYFVIDYDVVRSFIHPEYSVSEFYNDLALLEVKYPQEPRYDYMPRISCLWLKKEFPDTQLLAMGYGAPAFGKSFTYRLYQNNLTVIETDTCRKYYTVVGELPRGLVNSIICAYDANGLADTCEGDSGGPLLYKEDDWMRTAYLVGVISFGTVCLSGDPGAYTRVYSYLDWIENIISQNATN